MDKEEIKAKLDELSVKMEDLGERTKEGIDTGKAYAKEQIDEMSKEHKGNIEAIKENMRLLSERAQSKASSELLRAQMNLDVAKEKIAEKKVAYDKSKMEEYINDTIEYAESCVELSILAAEEAQLATLEAIAAQEEYEELYGSEE